MRCRRARKLLSLEPERRHGSDPALARHLAACPECERFAERWLAVRRGLERHLTTVTPDAGFAARIGARLEAPAEPLVWAARRLVPITLALTLALGGWCLLVTPTPSSLADELADGDLMSWLASGDEEER